MSDDEAKLQVRASGPCSGHEVEVTYDGERVLGVRAVEFSADAEGGVPELRLHVLEYEIDIDVDVEELENSEALKLVLNELMNDE